MPCPYETEKVPRPSGAEKHAVPSRAVEKRAPHFMPLRVLAVVLGAAIGVGAGLLLCLLEALAEHNFGGVLNIFFYFFTGRFVFYFAAWSLFAYTLSRLSREQDSTGDPALERRQVRGLHVARRLNQARHPTTLRQVLPSQKPLINTCPTGQTPREVWNRSAGRSMSGSSSRWRRISGLSFCAK